MGAGCQKEPIIWLEVWNLQPYLPTSREEMGGVEVELINYDHTLINHACVMKYL